MSMAVARLSRAESQAQTRTALKEAAARLFAQRGLDGTSVEAIAHEAGFTRGAFYSNFSSKEELFAEMLQERVYAVYTHMAERILSGEDRTTSVRGYGERVGAVQADPNGRWLFRLWLELLAHVDRDPRLRELAQGFWRGNRALVTEILETQSKKSGTKLPAPAHHLASAQIAMDVGLALQHYVDPDEVPLEVYPSVWEAVFGPLDPRD